MSEIDQHKVDVSASRAARNWTFQEQVTRLMWSSVKPLFAFSPRLFWGWRRWLLRLFGAQIGPNVHICPTVRILIPRNLTIGAQTAIGDRAILYGLGAITIGARVTISQGSHLCAGTHDWRKPDMLLQKLPITIENDSWICADAFVGPDVTIGARAIVGARAVVMRDIQANSIVAGNPAREIGKR